MVLANHIKSRTVIDQCTETFEFPSEEALSHVPFMHIDELATRSPVPQDSEPAEGYASRHFTDEAIARLGRAYAQCPG